MLEQRLANWSLAVLGSSMLLLVAFLAMAFAVAAGSLWGLAAVACVALYMAQYRYLRSIGRQLPQRRLRIWQLSLLAHGLVFAAVAAFTRDPMLAVALLVPEVASAALHMAGVYQARKALQQ